MSKTERLLAAVIDMQHYVTHDVDQSKCAACPRWDELQSAAMAAAGQIDALSAEIAALRIENDTLRAELESAHAAQRHAETELSQYMAWYAMAEHQHLHEQRRAEKAEAELAALRAHDRDGERWRTLLRLATQWPQTALVVNINIGHDWHTADTPQQIIDVIDAAMRAEG